MNQYQPIPVSDRILRLREDYLNCPVATQTRPFYYSADRWQSLYFLEGWLKYMNMPTTTLRRSYAEAYLLEQSRPIIYNDELIVGQNDFLPYTDEEQKRFDKLNEMFQMSPSIANRVDHICLDYEKLLRCGVRGLINEIKESKNALDFNDRHLPANNIEKDDFYEGCLVELEALIKLTHKYAAYARELAKDADEKRAGELMEIARIIEKVPEYPAESFREALQSIHFYTFNLFGLYPYGRPDQYLWPYYESDIRNGRLTREFAQELIDNFCMLYSTFIFSRAAAGFILGGRDKNGNLVENELTYMFLTSIEHVRMADPSVGLCVTEATSDRILTHAISLLAKGCSHPALFNDDAISRSLLRYGFAKEDIYNYINTTCVEITICGKSSMWTTAPFHNLMKPFFETLNSGMEFRDLEQMLDVFKSKLRNQIIIANTDMNRKQLERSRNGAEPLRTSCLVDDCVKRGKSIGQGGAIYNHIMPDFTGLANVADSFMVIDRVVFKEKSLTIDKLKEILDKNYEGHEELLHYISTRIPHYGNDNPGCDELAKKISMIIHECCNDVYTFRGATLIPGIFSYNTHYSMGKWTPATPDGRLKGMPLADSAGPAQGRDINGPTATILSVTSWRQEDFLGGIAVNMKFDKSMMGKDSIANMIALVKSFFQRGGVHIQINSVDADVLKAAMENPGQYRDLLVRIGGYSDYFVKLSKEMQMEILSRSTHVI